jgi:flagella basal body P-ring formation protein FlgA
MPNSSPLWKLNLCPCALVIFGIFVFGSTRAQSQDDLSDYANQWINQALDLPSASSGAAPLRPEVVVGRLDSRLQLAPCARIEPYIPKGTQLWGRSRVGLKCLEGPVAWNVFLPVTVKAWGPAWVMKRNVPANSVLQADDAEMVSEVDWAENRSPVVALPEQWVGMQAAFTLMPGQALRQNAVRPPQVFSVGSQVRVSTSGVGFEMSATGHALTAGMVGQSARVKLLSGKVVSGPVSKTGVVELAL